MALSRTLASRLSLCAALALPTTATAVAGDEFLINDFSEAWQEHPDVVTLKDGSFVVAWDTYFQAESGSFYFILAQRLSASGKKIGGEFIVNDDLVGQARHPTLAALPSGGFAVVWENSVGSVLNETDIYTRVFDAKARPLAKTKRVHGKSGKSQYSADVAATRDGYLVAYTSYEGSTVARQDEVCLQRVDGKGTPRGASVKINQATELDQKAARLATLSNGDVVAIWDSESGGSFRDGIADEVRGRIFDAKGKPLTREFVVSPDNAGLNGAADATDTSLGVAALPGGRFVVTWTETVLEGSGDDTTFEVRGRIFDGKGRADGREFVVRKSTEGVPRHSTVAALRNGGFVVAWDAPGSRSVSFQDASARVYDKNGRPSGSPFDLNQAWKRSDQELPVIAVTRDDRFLAVYESEFFDGDDDAIVGRMFAVRGGRVAAAAATSDAGGRRGTRSGGNAPDDLGKLVEGRTDGAPPSGAANTRSGR